MNGMEKQRSELECNICFFQVKCSFDTFDIKQIKGLENNYNRNYSCLKGVIPISCRKYLIRARILKNQFS